VADEHDWGVRVAWAGVDDGVRETVLVGGSVQVNDVVLGDDDGEMW
jgi:hypothetical protein